MKKLLLILFCLPFIGFGQAFQYYGDLNTNETVRYFEETSDGGFIILGRIENTISNYDDLCLIKVDANLNQEWIQIYSSNNSYTGYYPNSVRQTSDGGYIIFSTFMDTLDLFSNTLSDPYIIKVDANGNIQWNQLYDICSPEGCMIRASNKTSGGYVFVASDKLYKIDLGGNLVWTTNIGFSGITSIEQTTDGGYVMASDQGPTSTNGHFLFKTDLNGNIIWTESYPGWAEKMPGCYQTLDNGFISGGRISFGNQEPVILVKTNSNGVLLWSQNYSGDFLENEPISYYPTIDYGFILLGISSDTNGIQGQFFVKKVDENGNEEWSQIINDSSFTFIPVSIRSINNGGYIMTGIKQHSNNNVDIFLTKMDSLGNLTSTFKIPINPNRKLQKTVDLIGRETKGKKNEPLFYIYDDGTVEKKLIIE